MIRLILLLNMASLVDKSGTAVITGSSSGLGYELSLCLVSKGWKVYGIDIKQCPSQLDPNYYYHQQSDLTCFSAVDSIVKCISTSVDSVDLLVNCAGKMPTSIVARFDPLVAEDAFRVNVISPIYLSKLLIKKLKLSLNPKVINISSIASELAIPGEVVYSSTKAALSQASKIMSIEFARYGIAVYDVRPALIRTQMTKHLSQLQRNEMMKRQALQKELVPADFVKCILSIIDMPLETTGSITYIGGIAN